MALDMSDLMNDAELMDRFTVKRRAETVDPASGLSGSTPTTFKGVLGTVCAASRNDLERLDDADRMGRNISIVTSFQLRGPSKDAAGQIYKPDIVIWRGSSYVVKLLDPYPQSGFVQAVAGSVGVVDLAT